jgi:DNA/RNA-binding domain of Phe-tRNA-synthetase-like protein
MMNPTHMARGKSNNHGKNPLLIKTDELNQIPMKWRVYEDLQIKKRTAAVERWVKEKVSEIKAACHEAPWRDSEVLKGYISLHDEFSGDKGIPSSCEVLTDLILRNGSVPHINTFVDIYNVISVLTGISIGAHDTRHIAGTVHLEKIEQDMAFEPIGARGEGVAKHDEFAYVDESGVICRMDIKQCDRTKITHETTSALVIFQGHARIDEGMIDESIVQLEHALHRFEVIQ